MEFGYLNRAPRRAGFTLVELLVSIGIIALLVSILLPALQRARDSAATIKCAANLRSIGQGILAYAAENNQYLPAGWSFQGTTITLDNNGNLSQAPNSAVYGYVHWTSFIFGTVSPDAFECPTMTKGGFPACDPLPGNFDSGQGIDPAEDGTKMPPSGSGLLPITAADGTGTTTKAYFADAQALRCSYSLNEGLCGRNIWVLGSFAGASRASVLVSLGQVTSQSITILATEFVDEWGIVSSGPGGGHPNSRAVPPAICKSYRGIQPWRSGDDTVGEPSSSPCCDIAYIATSGTKLRRSTAQDLWVRSDGTQSLDIVQDYDNGNYDYTSWKSRLDFVGRNHGADMRPVDRKSNFLYLDGHVETKSILQTIPASPKYQDPPLDPWEWGAKCYSYTPNLASAGN